MSMKGYGRLIRRFADLPICRFADLPIWRFGNLAIWQFGDLLMEGFFYIEEFVYRNI